MDGYVKIKEVEKLTNGKIKDLKILQKDCYYLIGIDFGDLSVDHIDKSMTIFHSCLDSGGVNAILYPMRNGLPKLHIHKTINEDVSK